jgi:hypothetical protein
LFFKPQYQQNQPPTHQHKLPALPSKGSHPQVTIDDI